MVNRKLRRRQVNKSWLNPTWTTVGGVKEGPVDSYGAIPEPTAKDLLSLFSDTAYSCAKWSSDSVSSCILRAYVKTFPGQSRPKCPTSPVCKSVFNDLPPSVEVEQVIDHLLLALVERPNPHLSKNEMLRQVDLDLSLCGESFLEKVRAEDGLPCELHSRSPGDMTMENDERTGEYKGWNFAPGGIPRFIPKENIIWFKFVDPRDRTGRGYSPLRGMFERVHLTKNELAYLASLYRNQARPDSVWGVKGISSDGAERLQKTINQRFSQGGIGGVAVIDSDETTITPLAWSPKDVFGTDFYKYNRLQIFNGFGLNPAIFDAESANRATADTAYYMSYKNCTVPRLRLIEEQLTDNLASEFDERLFFLFDNPLPDDMSEKVALYTSAGNFGAVTREDWRDLLELPEKDWAQEPTLPAGVLPLSALQGTGAEHPDSADIPDGAPIPQGNTPDVADTALNGAQIASLLEVINSITTGVVSREAGKILISVAFPTMNRETINLLVDNLEVKPPVVQNAIDLPEVAPAPPPKKKVKYPSEKKLAQTLKAYFRKQEAHVLAHLGATEKAFINLPDWNKELDGMVSPIMRGFYEAGTTNFITQFGLSTDLFDVVTPKVDEALNGWTMKFCKSTNETTDEDIEHAHAELKDQLKEGIINKESFQRGLTDRVKQIYNRASTERAFLIAKTESVRAINTSQLLSAQAAEEKGVKIRKSIILSSNACPQCTAIKAQHSGRYPLDTVFNPHDDYGDGNPPFHPSCSCVINFEIL
jgi:HK97 family phage portal protein